MLPGIMFFGLEHSFLQPIHRLRQATIAVKKGGFQAPATITHSDDRATCDPFDRRDDQEPRPPCPGAGTAIKQAGGPLLLLGDIARLGFTQKQEFKDAIYALISLAEKTIGVSGLVDKQTGSFGKKDLQLVMASLIKRQA